MSGMESIIRPFVDGGVEPTPFTKPGAVSTPLVHVVVGAKGGTKTFTWSFNATVATKMSAVHKEKTPKNQALINKLAQASNA